MEVQPIPRLRAVIGATFVWKLGDGLIATALGYVALDATGSSFWVGAQYAVSLAGAAVAAAKLGRWMDRQPLITMVRVGVAICLVAIATVAVSPETTDTTVVGLMLATALVSVSFVLLSVALTAAVAASVPADNLLMGTTVARSAQLVARALGGVLLSVLLFATATELILAITAILTCLLWAICERVMRGFRQFKSDVNDEMSALAVFREAVRLHIPQRLVLGMLLCYGLFVSPFVALLPVLAEELTGNSKNVGWLSAVYFVGGAASVFGGYMSTRIRIPLAARALMSCGLSGLSLFAIAVSMSVASGTLLAVLGIVFTLIFGYASTMMVSVFNVAAQDFSSDQQRRRILSALILLGATVGTLAVLVAGWWSQSQGLGVVFLSCAVALVAFGFAQLRWRKAVNISPLRSS